MIRPPEDPPPAHTPPESLVALAGSLRGLTETILRVGELPPDAVRRVLALRLEVEALREALQPHAPGDRQPRMGEEPAGTRPFYVRGPVIGEHHPSQPLFEIEHVAGRTYGRVNFGVTYEGPPGCVHGGFVAFFFDQILGQHNVWSRIPAMTGTLTVRYCKATPILTDLEFEVRSRRNGERKVVTSGRLHAGDEVFCEAEGVFVVPRGSDWAEELS